ncbi:MAG: carboxylesterase family protein [Candidatus Binataceae bacterium]
MGASHGSKVQYIFRSHFPYLPVTQSLSRNQLRLSDQMMDYWTEFAATGRPGGRNPAWIPYDPTIGQVLSLAPAANRFESRFANDHQCAFWDALAFP